MKVKQINVVVIVVFLIGIMFLNACSPIRNFIKPPSPWSGECKITSKSPQYDKTKKTVFIIADYKLTELFDMLAPFYLFNATEKANVYIVSKDKTPIIIKRNLFVQPQLTFKEVDSLKLRADVIVIPALSIRDEHQDSILIDFIKRHYSPTTKMLSVCDGASTGAATGLYDGKLITCHASDYKSVKSHFSKPLWVQNLSVTKSGNLYSTAGVSNAVDGSLTVIKEIFGVKIMHKVLSNINYPYPKIKLNHQSIALAISDKFSVAKKIFFRKNKNLGILLENGINEFEMATILDTYSRTFPASFKCFILKDSTIQTKYGLTIINTGESIVKNLDELHVVMSESFSKEDALFFKNTKIIRYDNLQKEYLFNICLNRIEEQYGHQFETFVKISLDYN